MLSRLMRLVSTGMVLMVKYFKIAIEAICNFLESRHNEKIGIIKDNATAAGIVIAILPALMIHGVVNIWPMVFGSLGFATNEGHRFFDMFLNLNQR